jgi:two-component system chemotaxis response regulator CheB
VSRIKVMVVDASVVVRRLLSDVLATDPRIEVVGTAPNGKVALAKIPQLNPDVVTLEVEMPVTDGQETLTRLRREYPRLPVVMFSAASLGSATASTDAVRAQLIPRIVALCPVRELPGEPPTPAVRPAPPATAGGAPAAGAPVRVDLLAIGVSTGGPDALTTVLTALPADLPVPVVVVQHMPPLSTKQFADRLDGKSALRVAEGRHGEPLVAGTVLIAPGDFHMRVRRVADRFQVHLDQGTPENYCRPAVDVLFRSVAETHGPHALAVVLTGMGSDGTRGARDIVRAGGSVLAQDQATSVVWGMPGSVVAAGLTQEVLPLGEIARTLLSRLAVGRAWRAATAKAEVLP